MKKFIFFIFLLIIPAIVFSQGHRKKSYKRKKTHRKSSPKFSSNKNKHKYGGNKYTEYDGGLTIGSASSLTDVGGKKWAGRDFFMLDNQFNTTNLAVGLWARKRLDKHFAINASLDYAKISGSDLFSPGTSRSGRGKTFSNNIIELAGRCEYFLPKNRHLHSPLDYYGYAGLNVFYHNPNVVDTNPEEAILTAAEPPSYSKIQLGIPIGIGFYYTFTNLVRVGMDIGYRKTFTDYLDGFTRPASQGNDCYFFTMVNVSYVFKASSRTKMSAYRNYSKKFFRKK
jgi:hypothetical protein